MADCRVEWSATEVSSKGQHVVVPLAALGVRIEAHESDCTLTYADSQDSTPVPWAGSGRQDSGSKRGVRLFAHWTVMPSRRIIAMKPEIEMKIAIAVSP